MASKSCVNRLQKEYKALLKEPLPHIKAHPSPTNLLDWHYALEGVKGTQFEGGVYHGKIVFPAQYPYRPPSIMMLTPSGRFAVSQKLCLSMSDFHPESWNPMWSVGTILNGLLSFMGESAHTTGSISSTASEKRRLAAASLEYNLRSPIFRKLFPEYIEEHQHRLRAQQERPRNSGAQQNGVLTPGQHQPAAPSSLASRLGSLLVLLIMGAVLLLPFWAPAGPKHNGHIT